MNQFEGTIWAKHNTMEQTRQNDDFGLKGEKILKKKIDNAIKLTHLKTHSGEKSNKCNQCDYASFRVDHLRNHLKTHSV